MLSQIVSSTPFWVWGLLVALIWFGSSQLKWRVASRARVVRIALLMTALSLYGAVSAVGASILMLTCWLAAAGAVGYGMLRVPLASGTRYLGESRTFELPGSCSPLALMLGVFLVKYLVGVLIAIQAPIIRTALFDTTLGLLYGGFSGAFLGRAARLILLAKRTQAVPKTFSAS